MSAKFGTILNQLITRQLVRITVVGSDCYADIFHCNY